MPRVTSSVVWLLATVVLLAFALMSAAAPPAPSIDQHSQHPTMDVEVGPEDALDETARPPNACPVFCSTDEFCNIGCTVPQLCRNHRCFAF